MTILPSFHNLILLFLRPKRRMNSNYLNPILSTFEYGISLLISASLVVLLLFNPGFEG
jgi:hypothetical protein